MKNIIIVDRQDITRIGIESLIKSTEPQASITNAKSKAQLVKLLMEQPNSIVIIDYSLSDFRSIDELLNVSYRFSESLWILFSDELSSNFLKHLLTISTRHSVILKSSEFKEIRLALTSSFIGKQFICTYIKNQLHQEDKKDERNNNHTLTLTEKEILKEMALGRTTKEIAANRSLSFHTVTTHRKNIFRKLEVNNVHEATKHAIRMGIIDIAEYYI